MQISEAIEAHPVNREETIQRLRQCAEIAASSDPLTDDERSHHLWLCATEQARAEARRNATPQADLLGDAK